MHFGSLKGLPALACACIRKCTRHADAGSTYCYILYLGIRALYVHICTPYSIH